METKKMVEDLKRCAKITRIEDCIGCYYKGSRFGCYHLIKIDAADRLEAMDAQIYQHRAEIAELKKQLSEKQPEWISVEDEPPKEPGRILINRKNSTRVNTYSYRGNEKELKNFAYWMPMPKAPEPPKPKEPSFKDVLLEKFPKATTNDKGDPKVCRALIFGEGRCHHNKCSECWNQPYFEEEEKE